MSATDIFGRNGLFLLRCGIYGVLLLNLGNTSTVVSENISNLHVTPCICGIHPYERVCELCVDEFVSRLLGTFVRSSAIRSVSTSILCPMGELVQEGALRRGQSGVGATPLTTAREGRQARVLMGLSRPGLPIFSRLKNCKHNFILN